MNSKKERKKKENELEGVREAQGLICGIVGDSERWTAETNGGSA
jgi:hypothetical protein